MFKFIRAFTRIKNITPIDVTREEIEKELFGHDRGTHLLLGKFTEEEVYEELERLKIIDVLHRKGLYPVEVSIEHESLLKQKMNLSIKGEGGGKNIVELIIGECEYTVKNPGLPLREKRIKCLVVEWLVLQNPREVFSEEFPRLPGQRYPGLRIGKLIMNFLEKLARITEKDCFMAFPEFYHNAVMYIDYLHYLNPETEGKVLKMREDFKGLPLSDVSFAFCGGCIIERYGSSEKRISWEAEEMLFPISEELCNYFSSKEYMEIRNFTKEKYSYSIDWKEYENKKEELRMMF